MGEIPLLVLGFNRPESVANVFKALETLKPKTLLFAVDGPRKGNLSDLEKVKAVQELVNNINWPTKLETRFREQNLGLRFAVPDAVSWAIEKFGKVVVLEDDAIPGSDFLNYMFDSLSKFEKVSKIGHVSGYNQVPRQYISNPSDLYRLSQYPESYAWGTWERSWKQYNDNFEINLSGILESLVSKIVWNENFNMAKQDLISTWAFRWIAALWNNNLSCISPNVNLVEYVGHTGGTHTRRKPRAPEQAVQTFKGLSINDDPTQDLLADSWLKENIFRESIKGAVEIKMARIALDILKKFN